MNTALRLEQEQLHLNVYLQPKASRDQFLGLHGSQLKIAITAPPVDGKANAHLLKWLAKQCKVAKSQVTLIAGVSSRYKRIVIESPKIIPAALTEYVAMPS